MLKENEMKLKTVYEVRGDFANMGNGRTLGIFETLEEAELHTKGCGSLDCGGDGWVEKRLAVSIDRGYYLVDDRHMFTLGELEWSSARDLHKDKGCELTLVAFSDKIQAIKTIRGMMKIGLHHAKKITDNLPYTFELSEYGVKRLSEELIAVGCMVECNYGPKSNDDRQFEAHMDATDFMHEEGRPIDGSRVFADIAALRAKGTHGCGIVKVKVKLVEWVELPNRKVDDGPQSNQG